MSDISDIFYVIAAIIVFGVISIGINNMFFRDTLVQTESEIEYTAVALAHDIIEQARWMRFNDVDIFDNLARTDTTQHGIYQVSSTVSFVEFSSPDVVAGSATDHKRIDIIVSSDFMSNDINMSYIKSR
ncbi:MAG: hypothetical protein EA364_11490 [Balneolaceae bacterium]|jgi:hypothetical protein|nr:MAG: hypothetical protein EA364_11490 [Balneolaceae bacterium]